MKRLFICLILVYTFMYTGAQNSNLDYKYALKLYNLSSYEQGTENVLADSLMPRVHNAVTTVHYVHPTFAVQWKTKKQNFREIELMDFYVNKITKSLEQLDSTGNVEKVLSKRDLASSGISLRYEYIVIFKKSKQSKFVAGLGYAGNAYFKLDHFIPEQSNAYKNMQSTTGARGFIIPRLTYFMCPKFYLDLNLPVCVMDLYYRVDQNENPKIPVQQQRIYNFNFELFPKVLSLRLGVGLKI